MIEQYCTEAIACLPNVMGGKNPGRLAEVVRTLNSSVKFALPDNGMLLRYPDNIPVHDFILKYAEHIRIPYPNIAIQYKLESGFQAWDGSGFLDAAIVLCAQQERGVDLRFLYRSSGTRQWAMCVPLISIEYDGTHLSPLSDLSECEAARFLEAASRGDFEKSKMHFVEVWAVAGLIAALACSNSAVPEDIHPPKFINDKRIKKGKTPFYSYKILTLSSSSDQENRHLGGTHASPRVHLRRGHVRRLAEKTVWVNACVVGDKSKGVVEKDYAVSGAL